MGSLLALLLVGSLTIDAQAQNKQLQNFRPYNQDGVNEFEALEMDTTEFDGVKVYMGGAFAQQFQSLDHSTEANLSPNLMPADIGPGFNLATANLYMDAQLADGIRISLTTYLSSRHHAEAWVKGGYLQVDEFPMLKSNAVDGLMDYLTLKIGHMEINYGDTHFRRTDNARSIYNPFVGNLILDSFNTEVGGEIYFTNNGIMAMLGITNGELNPGVTNPDTKAPSIIGKLAYDKEFGNKKRFRLSGSYYHTAKSAANHLYSGDRAGARYYSVLDGSYSSFNPTNPDPNFRAPRITPGLSNKLDAFMINPFLKYDGLELFGVVETATGNAGVNAPDRTWNQYAVDLIYRFLKDDQVYIGGRYNYVAGELASSGTEVNVDRIQIGAGWYMTKNILMKVEYMKQTYNDYPSADLYHGAEVDGFMVEGAIAF